MNAMVWKFVELRKRTKGMGCKQLEVSATERDMKVEGWMTKAYTLFNYHFELLKICQ
jgi:hypothetical protein